MLARRKSVPFDEQPVSVPRSFPVAPDIGRRIGRDRGEVGATAGEGGKRLQPPGMRLLVPGDKPVGQLDQCDRVGGSPKRPGAGARLESCRNERPWRLSVTNYITGSHLYVGSDGNGLTFAQLSLITINGSAVTMGSSGELTAIPEPGTYATIVGVGALLFTVYRRRAKGQPVPSAIAR